MLDVKDQGLLFASKREIAVTACVRTSDFGSQKSKMMPALRLSKAWCPMFEERIMHRHYRCEH
eukprot:12898828-Prorocentrum_lima.AAC.1